LPPKIIEEKSTILNGPIQEGQTLRLYCHADGIPTPKVTWFFRRKSHHHHQQQQHITATIDLSKLEDKSTPTTTTTTTIIYDDNDNTLIINNISRSYTGIFECIANNSVPPAASRKTTRSNS